MIKASCRAVTTEDRKKEWPVFFVTMPKVGEYVMSEDGATAKIESIVHYNKKSCFRAGDEKTADNIECGIHLFLGVVKNNG